MDSDFEGFYGIIQDDISSLNDFNKAEILLNGLKSRATGGEFEEYKTLRSYFINKSYAKRLLPKWIWTNRNLDEFWDFIKGKYRHYDERRKFLKSELEPLLSYLEGNESNNSPNIENTSKNIQILNSEYINETWKKCLERKEYDPEGAITSARTLLESVLKEILKELKIKYKTDGDLNKLYKLVSKELNLSPENHNESVFRQILGGCSSIINGLASLRNDFGDSHGKLSKVPRPASRHAELAVNLSGDMCIFLLQTYENKKLTKQN